VKRNVPRAMPGSDGKRSTCPCEAPRMTTRDRSELIGASQMAHGDRFFPM
jgi:hypothetical protein